VSYLKEQIKRLEKQVSSLIEAFSKQQTNSKSVFSVGW
jgi:hypothetical protein